VNNRASAPFLFMIRQRSPNRALEQAFESIQVAIDWRDLFLILGEKYMYRIASLVWPSVRLRGEVGHGVD